MYSKNRPKQEKRKIFSHIQLLSIHNEPLRKQVFGANVISSTKSL